MRSVDKSRQVASTQEDKGVDITGRRWDGVGSHGVRRTL